MNRRTAAAAQAGTDRTAVRSTSARSWTLLIVSALSRATLGMIVAMAAWAAVPALFGWHSTTVSSGSMMPRLAVGDIAVSRPLYGSNPSLNQVLLFDDPDHPGRLRMHRFVRVNDDGQLVTRGDANPSEDSTPITVAAIRGIGTLRVPYIGSPIVWAREGDWLKLGGVVAGLLVLFGGSRLARFVELDEPAADVTSGTGPDAEPTTGDASSDGGADTDRKDDTDDDSTPPAPPVAAGAKVSADPARRSGWRRAARIAAGAVATLTIAVGTVSTVAVPAAARYTAKATNPTATFAAAASYYTCKSAVFAAATPLMYYTFDETSGSTANDTSGRNYDATMVGNYSLGATGACASSTAITFDGSTGYVATPTFMVAPNTFTLQVWFKTSSTKGGRLMGFSTFRTGVTTYNDRNLYLTNDGKLVFGVNPSGTVQSVSSAAGLNDGTWHLATATLSSAGMKLYVDEALVASKTTVTSGAVNIGYWRIGGDSLSGWPSAPTSNFLAGSMDNAAIFDTALAASDVAAISNAGS